MEKLIISLVLSGMGAAICTLCSLKMLQIYQLSSYRTGGFFKWFKRTKGDYIFRYFALAFFQFVSLLIFNFSFPDSYFRYLGLILYVGLGVYFIILQQKQKQKTPLKYTPRIIRQLALLAAIFFGLCFLSVYFCFDCGIGYAPLAAVAFFIPLCVTLTHFLALPIESLINKHYFLRAKKRLKGDVPKGDVPKGNVPKGDMPKGDMSKGDVPKGDVPKGDVPKGNIIKIGITGSFGKTTAKNILSAFLAVKYKVAASPASFNTPMGICKQVNGGGLDGCGVFIAEMGARRRGDIKKLCGLVRPDHGIITAAGAQHLETFRTLDAVLETKLELAAGATGFVIINSCDLRLFDAAKALESKLGKEPYSKHDSKSDNRFLYAGCDGGDARCDDITVGAEGTSFTLFIGGESVEITTPLLGRHIPPLVTACALLSHKLGVSLAQIKQAAAELKPVPHRLQLIKTPNGAVIDDAYNSNPQGAKNALEVLACFKAPRAVITPGFVELGAAEKEENFNLGKSIAAAADFLISVGNPEVFAGATAGGMDAESCFIEKTLDAAMERLTALKQENLTVLFLNDLPDNY